MNFLKSAKSLLYFLPPEKAHKLVICALRKGMVPSPASFDDDILHNSLFGLSFRHPVGLAAGFDKNGEAVMPLLKQGFSFVEAGTVTPLAQAGNPTPRLFRLEDDKAIINRLGFNNRGLYHFKENLYRPGECSGIVGANIGKNKNSSNDSSDYIRIINEIYGLTDYITINISSPNTPDLRDLQKSEALNSLLNDITARKTELTVKTGRNVPILIKIAPDITYEDSVNISGAVRKYGIDGIIISNTTIACRDNLKSGMKNETGGLSGRPLFEHSTKILRTIYELTGGEVPLIGVGGIFSGKDAYIKIRAGASLVQIYSALIYEGFEVISRINSELASLLRNDGFSNIAQAVGADIVF